MAGAGPWCRTATVSWWCCHVLLLLPAVVQSRDAVGLGCVNDTCAAGSLVPIIDVAALRSDDAEARAEVARKIGKACEDIGFFIIVNHGIPKDVIDGAWQKTLDFFDLPLEEKQQFITDDEAKYPYGYSALGAEVLSRGKSAETGDAGDEVPSAGDVKEMFNMGPKDERAGMPARRLPRKPEGFADAWDAYYEHANSLAQHLLRAFAKALEQPEDWFQVNSDRHISALRANNYPDQAGLDVSAGSTRCSAHSDYGTLTILRTGEPGLQVSKDREEPTWHAVPTVPDSFVINLGDLMRRWTNDKWTSTLHRVVNPALGQAEGRRLSLAFFHNLNKDAVVETIPSCISTERPAMYDPIVAGEFLMLKHLASNGKADADAHLKKKETS